MEAEREAAVAAATAAVSSQLADLAGERDSAQAAATAIQAELEEMKQKAAADKSELDRQLKVAQDYIQRMMAEKSDLDKRFHGMKDELIQRLQNACAQRDEARGQVMELDNRLQKAAADVVRVQEEARRAVAAAAAAAAAAGPAAGAGAAVAAVAASSLPPDAPSAALANGSETVLTNMRKSAAGFMQSLATQGPGYAKLLADTANTYLGAPPGGAATAGQSQTPGGPGQQPQPGGVIPGTPEHVPTSPAVRTGPAPQETELERRTRELQVMGCGGDGLFDFGRVALQVALYSSGRVSARSHAGCPPACDLQTAQCTRQGNMKLTVKSDSEVTVELKSYFSELLCYYYYMASHGEFMMPAGVIINPVSWMAVFETPWCCFVQAKQQQLIQEKRKQEEERLLAALGTNMGYHKGRPLAALVVFRACLQWRAFQADRTSVFDRIIQVPVI